MSVRRRALRGAAWVAGGSWLQLGLSTLSFFIITSRLTPADIGLFGVAALLVGFAQTMIGGLFTDSLQQRSDLTRSQTNATFWVSSAVSVALAALLGMTAPLLAEAIGASGRGAIIAVLALGVPLGTIASTPGALLARDLNFGPAVRVGALSALVSSAAGIVSVLLGAGLWSLVIADLLGKGIRLVGLFWAQGFRPNAPRNLGAISALMRFNLSSLGAYLIGYADKSAPRALAAGLLGVQGLGYLVVAERMLELLTQSVLSPLGAVTMSAVARLQNDPHERTGLIQGLYRISTILGYPLFIGAALVAPLVMEILGPQWVAATWTVQLMLLVGVRTTTGAFNIAILRGLGQNITPLALLGSGLALNLLLVPQGAAYGAAGVAAAVLLRTLATWPMGLWFIARATGLSPSAQLAAGGAAFFSALIMGAVTWTLVQVLADLAPLLSLCLSATAGGATYALALILSSSKMRRLAIQLVAHKDGFWTSLRAELRLEDISSK